MSVPSAATSEESRRLMTRHAVGLRDELQVRECHSMARSLRDQAHDESHERITEQLRVRRRAPKPRRLARTRGYNG